MRRFSLGSNLYIDCLNTGPHEPLLFQSDAVKMMSAVIMMELLVGAHAVRDRTHLHDLFRTFRKLGRLLGTRTRVFPMLKQDLKEFAQKLVCQSEGPGILCSRCSRDRVPVISSIH